MKRVKGACARVVLLGCADDASAVSAHVNTPKCVGVEDDSPLDGFRSSTLISVHGDMANEWKTIQWGVHACSLMRCCKSIILSHARCGPIDDSISWDVDARPG